jgi:hypothetical protein
MFVRRGRTLSLDRDPGRGVRGETSHGGARVVSVAATSGALSVRASGIRGTKLGAALGAKENLLGFVGEPVCVSTRS